MKNLVLGVIFSMFVIGSSFASLSSGLNVPGDKKKKCCTEKKDCKDGKGKKGCDSKGESKEEKK